MKQKIKFLLATIMMLAGMTAQAATITVTWYNNDISSSGTSFTKDGVTMNVTGITCDFSNKNFSGGTFTSTVGNFTKIEVTAMYFTNMGSGWSGSEGTATWTGTASSTVSFGGSDSMDGIRGMGVPIMMVFTIEPPTVNVTGITLSQTEAAMTVGGDALTLTPTVDPDNATDKTVTWTTSDASVATVANGVVTAVGAGTATITATATNGTAATSDDKTATCTVNVTVTVPVSGVTLSQTEAALNISETLTLTATIAPANATDKTVTWTTSDASVATVANGVVTAVAAGTATITATATNGTADTSDDFSATCTVTVTDPATKYDLTLADGSSDHGTVAFTVGGNAATEAKKDDVVTVSVTPNDGYSAKDVTVRAYTSWEAASEILTGGGDNPGLVSDINVAKQENGTWQFTMPEANVWVVVTYTKNLQDAWIQTIADQTYTGEAIEPTVTVQDGSTVLTLGTDYTVAYTNNVNTGTATVTVTGTGNYSGTATANFTIVADKSALNTAITEAETYYNSIKDGHATAANTLKEAIDAAKAVKDNTDATQEQVDAAITALASAKATAEQTVLTETKDKLADDITAAESYYESIKDDHTTAANTLKEAIDAAKGVKDNAGATQEQVDAAIAALASAKTTAEQTVLTETKDKLADDITAAESYYESIKDEHAAAANTLKEAIDAAKGVKDNAGATQEQVEAAIAALSTAINTAKVEVSRITLTIPAKSYMARIDADKRQIETAVAGVKLYSVQNVTNTEVVLTDELSVIAAEMPYFIYNDNDTEVEVSIIVSSEDADNVDYDSDHFKGTLVDKTFTDEDMEEYDHYVLNGGSSFVWVKDAGVLSAGKCWIELSKAESAGARRLAIVHEGETTGISTVKTTVDTKDAVIYDLQGRRVMQPTKGLFIVNGKKVVIK